MATQGVKTVKKGGRPNHSGTYPCFCTRIKRVSGVPNIKKLIKHEYGYRLRVGNWRILFDVFDKVSIVSIEEVKKRDERTY